MHLRDSTLAAVLALAVAVGAAAGDSARPAPRSREPAAEPAPLIQLEFDVTDVPPVYPSAARTLRVQGLVILEATIGPTGEVVDVEVLRSVPELDAAAVAAVEQWRYEPTLVDGEAVPVVMTVTITFALPGERSSPSSLPPPAGEPAQPAESPGSGETLESALFGQVLDAAGEPLPGTTIEAASPALPAPRVEVADRQGGYRISDLPPGTYTVTFRLPASVPSSGTRSSSAPASRRGWMRIWRSARTRAFAWARAWVPDL